MPSRPCFQTLTRLTLAAIATALAAAPALAQSSPTPGAPSVPLLAPGLANGVQNRITYQHGIEFVTIGAPGNAPWAGNGTPGDIVIGRGSVNYEYRIGRYEITTTQWVEFMNAAYDRPQSDWLPHLRPPDGGHWGAVATNPTVPGGLRWNVGAGQGLRGVGDISWRMAAMYCNWLHNDKSTARSAFLNGAYDVSTFGFHPSGIGFSDQLTHNANARFWIPTWDEWIKAAHYDPNKDGEGQGGYWLTPISQDANITYGPPGMRVSNAVYPIVADPNGPLAQANSGWRDQFAGLDPWAIKLGAYADVAQSPWGLLDAAGGTDEWTETAEFFDIFPTTRFIEGSAWRESLGAAQAGDILPTNGQASDFPSFALFNNGFRIAAAVPCGSSFVAFAVPTLAVGIRPRKRSKAPGC